MIFQWITEWKRKKTKKKIRQILGSCWRAKKAVEGDSDISCSWYTWNSRRKLGKKTGGIVLYNYGMIFLLIIFVNYILSFGLVGLWTIRLSAHAGAHIEYSSRSHAEDMTITNVIIKTPNRKWDWGVNHVMPGSYGEGIWWFQKRHQLRFWLWARPIQLGATGCMACVLGQLVEILTLGWAVHLGVGCGQCKNSQHSKNCVPLSPGVKKLNSRSK